MGSDDGPKNEKPAHRVYVDAFYLGKYEVTQREWMAVMGTNPSQFKGDNLPVESVNWDEVREYLKKLSQLTGKKFRLPTEAEWEYACRAGSNTIYYFGNDINDIERYAWYYSNSNQRTHPAGQKEPNSWGLYDMYGNVCEWCSDWYEENFYSIAPINNPKGPIFSHARTVRGGYWRVNKEDLYSAGRNSYYPSRRYNYIGFRCLQEY